MARRNDGDGWAWGFLALAGLVLVAWRSRPMNYVTTSDTQTDGVMQSPHYPFTIEQHSVPYHVEPIRSPIPGELPPFEDVSSAIQYP